MLHNDSLILGLKLNHVSIRGPVYASEYDECASSPCDSLNICINLLDAYSCQCAPGFKDIPDPPFCEGVCIQL